MDAADDDDGLVFAKIEYFNNLGWNKITIIVIIYGCLRAVDTHFGIEVTFCWLSLPPHSERTRSTRTIWSLSTDS